MPGKQRTKPNSSADQDSQSNPDASDITDVPPHSSPTLKDFPATTKEGSSTDPSTSGPGSIADSTEQVGLKGIVDLKSECSQSGSKGTLGRMSALSVKEDRLSDMTHVPPPPPPPPNVAPTKEGPESDLPTGKTGNDADCGFKSIDDLELEYSQYVPEDILKGLVKAHRNGKTSLKDTFLNMHDASVSHKVDPDDKD